MRKASENKFLVVKPGVVLTPVIEPVIILLEEEFKAANLVAYVTSGLRDSISQLNIIKKYVKSSGLEKTYPELFKVTNPHEKNGAHYVWQLAWSNLLNKKIIVNPPLPAVCLMDYFGPTGTGANKKGQVINQTPHANGVCFDIGGAGGEDSTIKDELVVMQKAMAKKIKGLINILPEHNNNCIHCDCR